MVPKFQLQCIHVEKDKLHRLCAKLTKQMPAEEIIPLLFRDGLLSKEEFDSLSEQQGQFQKNLLTVQFMITKPKGFLQKLCDLLSQTTFADDLYRVISCNEDDPLG